jgi:hypothetical protein
MNFAIIIQDNPCLSTSIQPEYDSVIAYTYDLRLGNT